MPAKLKYLRVDKFRHVRPGTRIEFGSQINTFVGKNGSGKSTLLDLISALIRNDFRTFLREDFKLGFLLADGEYSLEGTIINKPRQDVPALEFAGILRHGQVAVGIESNANESTIDYQGAKSSGPAIINVDGRGNFELIHCARLRMPANIPDLAMGGSLTSDILRSPNHWCTRMTEGIETFSDLFRAEDVSERAPTFGVTFVAGKDGKWFASGHNLSDTVLVPLLSQGAPEDTIKFDASAAMLAQFLEMSQYTDARIVFNRAAAKTTDGMTRVVFARPNGIFRLRNGTEISHTELSFGEKRLLAFMIKLFAYEHSVIVDELSNGMHHEWLEHCLALIEDLGTQAFLSSQDPLLLDCLPLGRETYGACHTLVLCELTEFGEMLWRNLTDAEVEDFFRSLDVGLQHISQIMRFKGLW